MSATNFGIVEPSAVLFSWYGDTVTEIQCRDDDGATVRLAVWNKTRRVIRSAYVETGKPADLDKVSGLARKCYGAKAFGHTEYYLDEVPA